MDNAFIYVTDIHYGPQPTSRKDDYPSAILKKLEYILKLAQKNKLPIINGGDLFDKPRMSILDLNRIIDLFMKYQDVPFITIWGNEGHDGQDHNSPLWLMMNTKVIQQDPELSNIKFGKINVILAGHNRDPFDMDEKYYDPESVNVLVTHTTLTQEPVIFDHILTENFQTKSEYVTIGHYHPYQGVFQNSNGNTFIAPGALSRRKRVSHDMDREPKFCVISLDPSNKDKLKIIEKTVPHEKDVWASKDIIDTSDIEGYDKISEEVEEMQKIIKDNFIFNSLSDMISFFNKNTTVDQNVVEKANKILGGIV